MLIEDCLNTHPYELLFVLIEIVSQNFKDAKVSLTEDIERLKEIVFYRVEKPVVDQIYDQYLHQSRI